VPLKPRVGFLLPGALNWIIESGETPYLIVFARHYEAEVPATYIQEDGTMILNVSGHAIRNLSFDDDGVRFDSRFAGQPHLIFVPYAAVLGLIGRESGEGIFFPENHTADRRVASSPDDESARTHSDAKNSERPTDQGQPKRPTLKLVD
jgi:stringent starvation protein B